VPAYLALGGTVAITADHGNVETMIDPVTGEPHTAHTTNPVPLMIAGEAVKGALLGERIDVALDGEGAREAKVFLDFAERGGDAVLPLGGLDKIEDLLLAFSEGFAHGVFT
jgi:hypothetical protein